MSKRSEPFDREGQPMSSLDDSIADALPRVGRTGDRVTLPVIVLGGVALGLLVLFLLSEQRARLQQARTISLAPPARVIAAAPPPLQAPTQPPAQPAAQPGKQPSANPTAPIPLPAPLPRPAGAEAAGTDLAQAARWKSPSLILDLSGAPNAAAAGATVPAAAGALAAAPALTTPITQALTPPVARAPENLNADERFAQRLGVGEQQGTAQATRMGNPATTMPQGSVISAVLETAINSDLPGYARAVVTREVRSFDGTTLLVPRGSHVIGQYRSGIALGQSRVFVVWTRLIRPDGVSIELASAGTDDLGRGGLEGDVDRHFLQRFGGSILLSLMGLTGEALSNGSTQVVINSTQGATNAAGVALQQEITISPTIDVPAGTPLRIFVARDLDFSAVESGH
jgi:type IV secretory pathway VirB10-like protein